MPASCTIQRINDLQAISNSDWNRCLAAVAPQGYPFLCHEFLTALEDSGSTGPELGWQNFHLVATGVGQAAGQIVGILPQFLKTDSYGEFVFDWQWAAAWEQAGGNYYPKLLTASPFSPVPGPRILAVDAEVRRALIEAQQACLREYGLSSSHLLFANPADGETLAAAGQLKRLTWQYQWFNHNYQDFTDFLAGLSSKKRKQIRRERRLVTQAGVHTTWASGHSLSDTEWQTVYRCYAQTYAERGSLPYLTEAFFQQISHALPEQVLVLRAWQGDAVIAATVCFRDQSALYGRYWGALAQVDCLHFELCYYAGIEYAIEHGLDKYDAGVQGEHKLARGFDPVAAESWHEIADPGFRAAIENFLQQESRLVDQQLAGLNQHRPYK